MPLTSADIVFLEIARVKAFVSVDEAEQLKVELLRRHDNGEMIGMPQLFQEFEVLDGPQSAWLLRACSKQARRCLDCARNTYLLAGQRSQNIPCEHCQGSLRPGRIDPERQNSGRLTKQRISTEFAHEKMREYLEKSGANDIRAFYKKKNDRRPKS
ncbi:MAG: hypothetical protein P1V97_03935 [Planctomycetota bacterium]|nr:hypothetical protein [Planctomycetota bacterium]